MFVRVKLVNSTWKPHFRFWMGKPISEEELERGVRERDSYHFTLMESKRVDGKPRQKVIKYLGSIKRRDISTGRIRGFWNSVNWQLDKLNLHEDIRQKIVDKIGEAIGVPAPCQNATELKIEQEKELKEVESIIQRIR